jgi:peptidoglycan/LPS O-acetylase OafA/YrhL
MNRKNNFDFLRLIFSIFVIITHSYVNSGAKQNDFLEIISNGNLTLSSLGLKGFFIISGYLIFQSFERSTSVVNYFWKRILRVFPALLFVLVLTLLLAPFVYQQNGTPYLLNRDLWTYIPRNITLVNLQYTIEGVFEHNPVKSIINGSLWTIVYEFAMYMMLSFLFLIKKDKLKIEKVLLISFFFIFFINTFFHDMIKGFHFIFNGDNFADFSLFFIAGSILASFKIENIRAHTFLLAICILILFVTLNDNLFNYVKYFTLPVVVILIGIKSTPILNTIADKIGDLSYGIYLFGSPVMQTLMYYHKLDSIELAIYTTLISSVLACVSWNLIEKNALKLKNG